MGSRGYPVLCEWLNKRLYKDYEFVDVIVAICKMQIVVNKPKAVFVFLIGKIKGILRAKMIRGFFKNGSFQIVASPIR